MLQMIFHSFVEYEETEHEIRQITMETILRYSQ